MVSYHIPLQVPNTAMIVTHDLVRPDDDVHYKDKIPVGRRFARAALHLAYGRDIPYTGPICREALVEGGHIRLLFDHLCGGLESRGGPLGGFCIAGADREWTWADARIDGDTVIVNSSQVAQPAAVRYAWSKYRCGANLFNKAGLPTPTFCTDTWPLTSRGKLVIEKD